MKALSPTDSMFLWIEKRSQPMHVAGMQIFTPPPGAGEDYVRQSYLNWRQQAKAVAPFNLRPLMKNGIWYWEEDEEFDIDYHLRHSALPRPGRVRELLALVSQLHSGLLDRNRPLWEWHLIEGLADGRFALYVKIHHALIDGVTGAKMMAAALSTAADEIKPPLWAQDRPKPTKSLDASAQRVMHPLFDAVRAGGEILPGIRSGLMDVFTARQRANSTTAMPFQAPPTLFNVAISGSRRFVAQSYSLARLRLIGKTVGATVNDVTLAICAGAMRRYLQAHDALPEKPLIAMVPVSLHGETDKGGNQVGVILANLATHIADPVDRLRQIKQSTSEAKSRLSTMSRLEKIAHAATMLGPMVPGILTGKARDKPIFNIVISNVPGPETTLYLNGARLDEAYPVSIPADFMALNITVSGNGDNLGFGYTACRRSVPALQRMVDFTDASIVELEAALKIVAPKKAAVKAVAAKAVTARKTPARKAPVRSRKAGV
jgi:diacylglycerol O-acyltransferase